MRFLGLLLLTPRLPPSASFIRDSSSGKAMTRAQLAAEIKRIVENQLDDCHRAIKEGTKTIAIKELEDARKKLKSLAAFLQSPPPREP